MYCTCACRYWENAERDYQELSTYYGLPSISFKAASYHQLKAGVKGSSVSTLFGPTGAVHPAPQGHRLAAELVGTLIQVRGGLDPLTLKPVALQPAASAPGGAQGCHT